MTRIIGGRWGSRHIDTPSGAATRPTSEKVRGGIANALDALGALEGASVLDLYSGSGALGLELASRGATRVVFVERARDAQAAIAKNIAAFNGSGAGPGAGPPAGAAASPGMTLFKGSAATYAASPGESFDVVVADPPYAEPNEAVVALLESLLRSGRFNPGAEIVFERGTREGEVPWPEPLTAGRARRYGATVVCYGHAP